MTAQISQQPPDSDDDAMQQDPTARSAAAQGSTIPLAWRPTAREPMPVVRCTAIKKNGDRCNRWSIRGTTVCLNHGGRLPNVQEHANAVVEAARLRLIGLSDAAIDQIEDLMVNASAEAIRLKASQDVLDRAGIRGPLEIEVTHKEEETAADRVNRRLAQIASRVNVTTDPTPDPVADTIDAIIEDDDDDTDDSTD